MGSSLLPPLCNNSWCERDILYYYSTGFFSSPFAPSSLPSSSAAASPGRTSSAITSSPTFEAPLHYPPTRRPVYLTVARPFPSGLLRPHRRSRQRARGSTSSPFRASRISIAPPPHLRSCQRARGCAVSPFCASPTNTLAPPPPPCAFHALPGLESEW